MFNIHRTHAFIHKMTHHGLSHLHEIAPAIVLELPHMGGIMIFVLTGAMIFVFAAQIVLNGEA